MTKISWRLQVRLNHPQNLRHGFVIIYIMRTLSDTQFGDRAPACTALVYVDDATSRLMVVLFAGVESTFAYFEATHQCLKTLRHAARILQ
jgi:hypothetical protein